MTAMDKRRVALNLLKLSVLVLFTLNLYIFTSNTLNYASSPPQTIKLEQSSDLRFFLVDKPNQKPKENNQLVVEEQNYNECNYMGLNVSKRQCDLVITVKTSSSFYDDRLKAILNTWVKLVPSKVRFKYK